MKIYTYYRSSSAYRVRIALNLKELDYDAEYVHLTRNGGEQFGNAYTVVNPQNLVPALEIDGEIFTQSLSIIEYLDEVYGGAALLPKDAAGRARVRQLALSIACEIHPLNNLRVLNYLTGPLQLTDEKKTEWYCHWVALGLSALEQKLSADRLTGVFCHGDRPTLADCCLVPQIYNARRFGCDLNDYPAIRRIVESAETLDAFQRAHPDRQPDAE
jgi:maleylpyruvate isomerase